MLSTLRKTSVAALVFASVVAPAIAAGTGTAAGAGTVGAVPTNVVTSQAAGSTGYPGSTDSTTGSNMANSSAELPNNDASTPINNGPAKSGSTSGMSPNN